MPKNPRLRKKPVKKKKLSVRRFLKPPTKKRKIKRNIAFCERALKVLETQDARDTLLKGKIPLHLRRMSYELAMMEILSDVVPDADFMKLGIWLPDRQFMASGNKFVKWILYYGYWKGGPYFMPVHATVHLLMHHIPNNIKKRYEIRAGKLIKKRFSKEGKLEVTNKDIDELIQEFHTELERNKKALREIK